MRDSLRRKSQISEHSQDAKSTEDKINRRSQPLTDIIKLHEAKGSLYCSSEG